MSRPITIEQILLTMKPCIKDITYDRVNITFKDFKNILVYAGLTESEFMIREKWRTLHDLKIFQKINQSKESYVIVNKVEEFLIIKEKARSASPAPLPAADEVIT